MTNNDIHVRNDVFLYYIQRHNMEKRHQDAIHNCAVLLTRELDVNAEFISYMQQFGIIYEEAAEEILVSISIEKSEMGSQKQFGLFC